MSSGIESDLSNNETHLNDFIKKLENDLVSLSENRNIENLNNIDNSNIINNNDNFSYIKKNIDIILYIILFIIFNHDKTIILFKNNINSTNNINLLFRSLIFGIIIYIIKNKIK